MSPVEPLRSPLPLEYADDSLEDFENADKDKEFAPRVAKSRQLFRDYIATHDARAGKGRDAGLEKDAVEKFKALNDYTQMPGHHIFAVRQGQNPYPRSRRDVNHGVAIEKAWNPFKRKAPVPHLLDDNHHYVDNIDDENYDKELPEHANEIRGLIRRYKDAATKLYYDQLDRQVLKHQENNGPLMDPESVASRVAIRNRLLSPSQEAAHRQELENSVSMLRYGYSIPYKNTVMLGRGENPYKPEYKELLRSSQNPKSIDDSQLIRASSANVSKTPVSQMVRPVESNSNVNVSKYTQSPDNEIMTVRKSFDIVIIVKAIGNVIDPQEQAELEQALKEKYKTVEPHQLKDSSSVFVLRDGSIVMAPRNHIHWDMAHSVLHDKIAPKEYPEDDPDDHTDYIKELMHRSGATRVGTFDRGVDAHGIHPLTADAATSIGQIVKHNPRHFTGYAEHPSDVFKSRENDNFGQFQSDLVRVNGEPIHSRSVPVHSDLIDPETGIRNDADIRQSAQGVLKFAAPRKKNNVIAAQSNYYKALDKMAPDLTKTKLEGLRMPSRDVLLAFVMSKANASSNSRRRNMKFKIVKATDY